MSRNKYLKIVAAPSTLAVFMCMTLPFFVLFAWLWLFRQMEVAPVIVTGALCGLAVLWWQRFRLEIGENTVSYRSLFAGTKRLGFDDIGGVIQIVDFKSRGFRPPIRLEVYACGNRSKPAFDINLKVLSIEDVARIKAALAPLFTKRP